MFQHLFQEILFENANPGRDYVHLDSSAGRSQLLALLLLINFTSAAVEVVLLAGYMSLQYEFGAFGNSTFKSSGIFMIGF